MGLLSKLKRTLGRVEGHEDEVASKVSDRTSVSEEKVKEGLDKAQEAAGNSSENS
jgi:uncharacterized protein YjbJ (UPF0337 family)